MLEENNELSIRKQCSLLSINRATVYNKSKKRCLEKIEEKVVEKYIESGCRYGYRKIAKALSKQGDIVNHKKVLTIMQRQKI